MPTLYRAIAGCPGYRVGDDGTVWSCWPRNRMGRFPSPWRMMTTHVKKHGYVEVTIRDSNKIPTTRLVHRLVLEAFVGPCPDGLECRHMDGDRTNNSRTNLLWGTPSDNANDKLMHGTAIIGEDNNLAVLTENQVRSIRRRYARGGVTQTRLAEEYGVTQPNISEIIRRRTWKHL